MNNPFKKKQVVEEAKPGMVCPTPGCDSDMAELTTDGELFCSKHNLKLQQSAPLKVKE